MTEQLHFPTRHWFFRPVSNALGTRLGSLACRFGPTLERLSHPGLKRRMSTWRVSFILLDILHLFYNMEHISRHFTVSCFWWSHCSFFLSVHSPMLCCNDKCSLPLQVDPDCTPRWGSRTQFHIEKHQNLNSRQDLCFSRAFANHRMFHDAILHSEALGCQV